MNEVNENAKPAAQVKKPHPRGAKAGAWIIAGLAILFLAIVIALIVGTGGGPGPAETSSEFFVVAPEIKLRSTPSAKAAVVSTLRQGDEVTALESQGPWVRVKASDGLTGWAERSALEGKAEHERRTARINSIKLLPTIPGRVEDRSALYSGPGIFYPVVGELRPGMDVKVYTRDHDFYAVEWRGELAYASVDSITLSGGSAPEFQVAAGREGDEDPTGVVIEPPTIEEPPRERRLPEPPPPPPVEARRPSLPSPDFDGIYPGVPPGGTAPEVIDRVIPRYPMAARRSGIEGSVILRVVVKSNGRVGDVEILQDLPQGLGDAAANAVRRWRFRPARVDGRPIDVYYNVTVNFRLAG